MITFILGTAGSGKSREIANRILKDLRSGLSVILLVPEQMAISAERLITEMALSCEPPVPTANLEILNFTRLANRVFRTLGGISQLPLNRGGKTLMMYRALVEAAPLLIQYQSALSSPETGAPMMLAAMDELRMQAITPSMLLDASAELNADNPTLSEKLRDLAVLYEVYRTLLRNRFDDPTEDLARLCDILKESDLFSHHHIYFDSFNGFTAIEYEIVSLLFRRSANATFSLCFEPEMNGISAYSGVCELYRRLCRIAPEHTEVYTSELYRYRAEELKHICKNLWRGDKQAKMPLQTAQGNVRIVEAANHYAQADFVAHDILRRVRDEGAKYADFAVIAGDALSYHGVIDTALRRCQIPCFLSVREDMTQIPIVKYILTLLTIKRFGWRCEDILDLMKTGLTNLSEDECDLLESYADTWRIHGRRWYDEDDWTMHPRGYLTEFTDEDTAILQRVNEYRRRLTEPILEFHDAFLKGATVRSVSEALYQFLNAHLDLTRLARNDSARSALIANTIVDVLDEYVSIVGDLSVDAELYGLMFTLLIRETDIGRIPATIDEVVMGSASLLRLQNARHVYLIGANDGEFPASASESSIFSDSDKVALDGIGITLSPTSADKNEEGLFHFWRSACSASESLCVLYSASTLNGDPLKPSLGVMRLKALFSELTVIHPEESDPLSLLTTPSTDFSLLRRFASTPFALALTDYYRSSPEYAHKLSAISMPICRTSEQLSRETTELLYPSTTLSLSQSRLEDYVNCAFGYHCKHVLRLSQTRPALIRPTDTGIFVHHILDRFFRAIRTEDGIRTNLTREEIDALTEAIIGEYLSSLFGFSNPSGAQSERLLALFRRLKRATTLVIDSILEEFSHSSFVPTYFEMPIGFGNEENTVPPLSIPLSDGTRAYLIGRIDRVDTFKRGNDVYLRVVDYKTGSKSFSVKDLDIGLNMQMLLYLFAIWNHATPKMKKEMGVEEDGKLYPAGVLYCPAKPSTQSSDTIPTEAQAHETVTESLKRSGMLLDDKEILAAMDHTETLRFLPVKFNKDGSPTSATIRAESLETLEGFGKRMRSLSDKIEAIATEMKGGNCRILPLKETGGKIDACRFCDMKSVCRNLRYHKSPVRDAKGGNENE